MSHYNNKLQHTPLGRQTVVDVDYNPDLLCAVARADSRQHLQLTAPLPFRGEDRWTAYEVSWLTSSGKPCVALAEFVFPYNTAHIIESKSLKLYLHSLNQTVFASAEKLQTVIAEDLSERVGGIIHVQLLPVSTDRLAINNMPGTCLDALDIAIDRYHPDVSLLDYNPGEEEITEVVYSHLLRTNCPVTDQPDWATVWIEYTGKPIVHAQLLKYIISYRQHQDFHEHCVEKIFCDILQHCRPTNLTVCARYTRRGGLDINPLRTNANPGDSQLEGVNLRTHRQ